MPVAIKRKLEPTAWEDPEVGRCVGARGFYFFAGRCCRFREFRVRGNWETFPHLVEELNFLQLTFAPTSSSLACTLSIEPNH
jgi:hypothetical protein